MLPGKKLIDPYFEKKGKNKKGIFYNKRKIMVPPCTKIPLKFHN